MRLQVISDPSARCPQRPALHRLALAHSVEHFREMGLPAGPPDIGEKGEDAGCEEEPSCSESSAAESGYAESVSEAADTRADTVSVAAEEEETSGADTMADSLSLLSLESR